MNEKTKNVVLIVLAILVAVLTVLFIAQYLSQDDGQELLKSEIKGNKVAIDSLNKVIIAYDDSLCQSSTREQKHKERAEKLEISHTSMKRLLSRERTKNQLLQNQRKYEQDIAAYDSADFDTRVGVFTRIYKK